MPGSIQNCWWNQNIIWLCGIAQHATPNWLGVFQGLLWRWDLHSTKAQGFASKGWSHGRRKAQGGDLSLFYLGCMLAPIRKKNDQISPLVGNMVSKDLHRSWWATSRMWICANDFTAFSNAKKLQPLMNLHTLSWSIVAKHVMRKRKVQVHPPLI